MQDPLDIAILGSGPAALVALRLLHVLEYRVALVAPQAVPRQMDIVLPLSTLQSLEPLGLRERVTAAGRAITSHEVHWGTRAGDETPGRDTGLQIREARLFDELAQGLPSHLFRAGEVRSISETDSGVRVTLAAGAFEARAALCAVPDLLPDSCRPTAAAPSDVATTATLSTMSLDRFPAGHHFLESGDAGWAWAVRTRSGVQLTHFGEPGHAPPSSRLTTAWPPSSESRIVTPTRPRRSQRRILAIGRAAFTVSPLSSLGTAHAIHTASDAVAVANSHLHGVAPSDALDRWYEMELLLRASRTHALTAKACADAHGGDPKPFWGTRSEGTWRHDLPAHVARIVSRFLEFMDWSTAAVIDDRRFQLASSIDPTTVCVRRGPVVREEPALARPGGVSVPRAMLDAVPNLLPTLASVRPVRDIVSACVPPDAPAAAREAARKHVTQLIGRLYETGIVDAAD